MDRANLIFKNTSKFTMDNVVFVDPGLGGTGLAYFKETCNNTSKLIKHQHGEVLRGPKNERWENQSWSIAVCFRGYLQSVGAKNVVIEMPKLFAGNAISHASASKGDLFKLTYLVGSLGLIACEATGNLPYLISPQDWKGQLPKDAVINRIERAYKDKTLILRDHEADAVGMGVAAQGRLVT